MNCKNCNNELSEDALFCSKCGVTSKPTDVEQVQQIDIKEKWSFKKIFTSVGISGIVAAGSVLSLVFVVIRFLYIALAGLSTIWFAVNLFQHGSVVWGLVVLIVGTPISIGIASLLFLPLFLFSIWTLIIWGIVSIFGFDVSFYGIWDFVWLSVKILILGVMAFFGIKGFIESAKQKNIPSSLKENLFYILLFLFLVWIFFISGNKNKDYISNESRNSYSEDVNYNEETSPLDDTSWVGYTSKEDRFSIEFPEAPKVSISDIPEKKGKIIYNTYISTDAKLSYAFAVLTYKYRDAYINADPEQVDSFLKNIFDFHSAFQKSQGNEIVFSNYGYLNGLRVLNFSSNGKAADNTIVHQKDTLIYSKGIFYILAIAYDEEYDNNIYSNFINSFRVN